MIKQNLAKVKKRIGSTKTTLVAVSKTRSADEIKQAALAGQKHFGENYLQEALEKIQKLKEQNLIWHFIGPIQSNKTNKIAQNFNWVHSVDRLKIAKRLDMQRPKESGRLNILLQINIDNEVTKSGIFVAEIDDIVKKVQTLENIKLRGFMCIPDPNNTENSFARMQKIFNKYPNFDTLSMGMSNDLELAIKYGATFVRIGTDIFGKRI